MKYLKNRIEKEYNDSIWAMPFDFYESKNQDKFNGKGLKPDYIGNFMFGYIGIEHLENVSYVIDKSEFYNKINILGNILKYTKGENLQKYLEINNYTPEFFEQIWNLAINLTNNDEELLKYGAGVAQLFSDSNKLFNDNTELKDKLPKIFENLINKYNNNEYTQYFDNNGDSEDIQDGIDIKTRNEREKKWKSLY